jgi:outer membrane protein TolC
MRVCGLLLLTTLLVGCTRAHYRLSADREVYPIVADRNAAAGDFGERMQVEPNPASRLADPTNPDRPPRPPDDAVASIYMKRPNGMHGAHWPKKSIDWIEPPDWEAGLPWSSNGKVKLDADKAFELALLNSREYQTALENLYLAALTLTLNRYEFQTRWFLTNATDFTSIAPGTTLEQNSLTSNTHFGFNQAFAAGGQLVVDFANSFLLEFNGTGQKTVSSTFVANFVQPLLRNAGKRVRLEQLTQAERDVLYAARDFYRFRKQFWATITTLDAGYLSLLSQVQNVRNAQFFLVGQEQNLREHEALLPGGKITTVQVDQAFQAFQQARATVAQSEATLQTQFDQFKLLLGLPPHVPIELDDSFLNPFVLSDPKLDALRETIDVYLKARYRDLDEPPALADLRKQYQELDMLVGKTLPFIDSVGRELDDWGRTLDPSDADDARRARAAFEQFRVTIPETRAELNKVRTEAKDDAAKLAEAKRKEGWEALAGYTRRLLTLSDQLIGVQAQIRINQISLPAIEWKEPEALAMAKASRLDLQSEQARVTDAWRKVLVAANQLKAELSLVASANRATPLGENSLFNFTNEQAQYKVGLLFDGPLNRQAERNAYRTAQINYQRARRDYMQLSDQIEQSVRRDLRLLELQKLNFEIARLTLVSATRQLEGARQRILLGRDQAGSSGTLDILNALNAQLNARNALSNGYINYEQLRVQLMLDLEALQLDSRGYPIDERRSNTPDGFAAQRRESPTASGAGGAAILPPPRNEFPAARIAGPSK